MLTLIICASIGAILFIVFNYERIKDLFDYGILGALDGILGALAGVVIGLMIACIIPSKTETVITSYSLEAIQDGNGIHGSFFLGCGTVDNVMQYTFYYQQDGYYKLKQVNYQYAKIKYSEDKPKVEKYEKQPIKGAIINKFSLFCGCKKPNYIIYIPQGSIKQNYLLDAQ